MTRAAYFVTLMTLLVIIRNEATYMGRYDWRYIYTAPDALYAPCWHAYDAEEHDRRAALDDCVYCRLYHVIYGGAKRKRADD